MNISEHDIRRLLASTGGPPLGIAAAAIIDRGRRIHPRRKGLAVLASAAAAAGVVLPVVLTTSRKAPRTPMLPARPVPPAASPDPGPVADRRAASGSLARHRAARGLAARGRRPRLSVSAHRAPRR
jgi:hypothetical protein